MCITTRLQRMSADENLLTTKEAGATLGLSPWWVRRLIDSGELRAINVGGADKSARWRIGPEDIVAFMRSRESRPRDLLAG